MDDEYVVNNINYIVSICSLLLKGTLTVCLKYVLILMFNI